ncbi:MAG: hypothetical protein COZ34_03810 [Candidatus Pacebacteria bacterium CG_4_10_14_3_um_filter_34_15]|nr:MAG: hypothetical protein COV78_00070 [Candidatus Pacebacteria bacterium CG11_big_fil_rev_8_21_14_0_20_34_55]PIX81325.1 MAG: hypothetical protein COZ34_03810 [Candidatus Pacebacteria bacterium CG_4_10_14_3_um_filter_34_15]PJC43965.1 MAG: hypothetical protein CO039_01290 [Candidatus Pacebacteria bacterium CG_4_9_14_0_2_um_filter_34_50]
MPIQLSLIRELKTILEEDYNLNLSMEETTEIAVRLLGFVETLIKIESKATSQSEGKESVRQELKK